MIAQSATRTTAFHMVIEEGAFRSKWAFKSPLIGSCGQYLFRTDIHKLNGKESANKKQLRAKWKKENGIYYVILEVILLWAAHCDSRHTLCGITAGD
ncbi:MAG: hypothetical protein P4L43_04975 [Syntrophobacteraceae bacterium]|nr:hypothetical protein [Syntrophobacteraceae bacterium]